MTRPLRIEYPGAYYHVTSRGNERKNIFINNRDRERFLSYLKSAHLRYGAVIHGTDWCQVFDFSVFYTAYVQNSKIKDLTLLSVMVHFI